MALVDVVKWDNPGTQLVWKYPKSDLSTATQLIVNESQKAILFKNGQRFDIFSAGRHTLSTQNIPLLNKLVNLPFGGKSPFAAEVWFVNQTIPLDLKFGTPTPLQVEDPTYQIVVPVRAFGQFGLQIEDPGLFVHKLVGANAGMDQARITEYFKGILVSRLKSRIAQVIVREKIGVLEIETMLDDISRALERDFGPDYAEYGLGVRSFRIMSITVPEDDSSVLELKKAKAAAARRRIEGTNYAQERGFDVLQTSAGNTGAGGAFASIGAGLGMGQAIGGLGQQMLGGMNPQQAPPAFRESRGRPRRRRAAHRRPASPLGSVEPCRDLGRPCRLLRRMGRRHGARRALLFCPRSTGLNARAVAGDHALRHLGARQWCSPRCSRDPLDEVDHRPPWRCGADLPRSRDPHARGWRPHGRC